MKIVLAFDSYKGCLTASEACRATHKALHSLMPDVEVVSLPMSDGGEGLVECVSTALKLTMVEADVCGPIGETVRARYAISADGSTAYMEAAAACGLTLVPTDKRNPMLTTTRGVGEMLMDAVQRGCKQVVIGLGGSATCDGGMCAVDAMMDYLPLPLSVTVACDVRNPLYGPQGAAYIFAPQKGASPSQTALLDQQLREFAQLTVQRGYATTDLAQCAGAGAAGGLGYALMAYLGAQMQPGAELVADVIGLRLHAEEADYIITGEGRSDSQTLMGKVPAGVLEIGKQLGVPVILLSGAVDDEALLRESGFAIVTSINAGDERPLNELMRPEVAMFNIENTIQKLDI